MPIFIICSVLLASLVLTQSLYLPYLSTDAGLAVAWTIALLCLAGGWSKKVPSGIWQDGFAVGVLLLWFGDWRPLFNDDVPMFHVFPVYFAVLSAWATFAIINRSQQFDRESRDTLRYMQNHLARFDTPPLAALVLASTWVPEQYLLFPSAMTLFVLRYAMQRSLELIDS